MVRNHDAGRENARGVLWASDFMSLFSLILRFQQIEGSAALTDSFSRTRGLNHSVHALSVHVQILGSTESKNL